MKIRKPFFLINTLLSFFIFALLSCQHETINKDALRTIYFDKEVLPIFQTNCAGCHDGSNEFDLSYYEGIMKGISKGEPKKSELYQAITSDWLNPMPPSNPLSLEQRTLIRLWIEQGAQNNTAPVVKDTTTTVDTTKTTDTTVISESYRVCFSRDILPVLLANCSMTNCHNASSAEEGVVITNYSNVMKLVAAGKPYSSKLYEVITTSDAEDRMPFKMPALPKAAIDSIRNWIANGALNEDCPSIGCDTSNITFSGRIKPLIDLKCKICHNASLSKGNTNLDGYSNVATVANSSLLINALRGSNGATKMPQGGSLDECTIKAVELWVKSGAVNN